MSDLRVEHKLGREGARARLEGLARKHGLALQPAGDGCSGTLEKSLSFVGTVRARYRVLDDAVEVDIEQAPAFPSAETIRRMVGEELARALSG